MKLRVLCASVFLFFLYLEKLLKSGQTMMVVIDDFEKCRQISGSWLIENLWPMLDQKPSLRCKFLLIGRDPIKTIAQFSPRVYEYRLKQAAR